MKLPTENPPSGNLGDTLYLLINPPWDAEHGYNFSTPGAIYFGKDTYLYIADSNMIYQADAAGTIHATITLESPYSILSISQDELMRLLIVTGEKRIYKIDMGPAGDRTPKLAFEYGSTAYVADSASHLFKQRQMIDSTDRFTSITDIPYDDKSYFVSVSSDQINNGRILWFWGDADDAELSDSLFDSRFLNAEADSFKNPIVGTGNGITTTTEPNMIYAYDLSGVMHLVVCQDAGSYPVHDMKFERQPWNRYWVFNYTHFPGQADIISPGMFDQPSAATVDLQGNIYVADKGDERQCGAYKFSKNGILLETFCEPDSTDIFLTPGGISYDIFGDRRTAFIADTGNRRILRFKLSTDIEQ